MLMRFVDVDPGGENCFVDVSRTIIVACEPASSLSSLLAVPSFDGRVISYTTRIVPKNVLESMLVESRIESRIKPAKII